MNYYPFHLGDYAAHTAHLEPMEDLAFRRMLDLYYLRECALPAEPAEVARLIRLRAHVTEVQAVLSEFFALTEGGWISKRCDEEIMRMQDKQAKAKASAEASVAARQAKANQHRSATVEPPLSVRSTDVELPTPTPTPTPVNTSPVGDVARKRAPVASRPDDVPDQVWQDFQAIRKAKRSPLTDTALDGIEREASKAGVSLADAIAYCCQQGWQGFNAGWYAERQGGKRPGTGETEWQRSARERMQQFAPGVAAKAPTQQPHNVIDLEIFDVPAIASR